MMTSLILVVLCGLPASGKTTFVRKFRELLRSRQLLYDSECAQRIDYEQLCVVHVCYDELVTCDIEKQWKLASDHIGQEADIRTGLWKQYRNSVLKCVEEMLIKPSRVESRVCAPALDETINRDIKSVVTDVAEELVTQFAHVIDQSAVATAGKVIVFLDDNMYYTSMRHAVYQLARQYSVGFAQLYFPVTLKTAIERNRERGERDRVPADVIEAMSSRLEAPGSTVNSWERLIHVVDSTDQSSHACETVLTFLQSALCDPVLPQVDPYIAKSSAREACLASDLHSADTRLRKLIGQRMKELRESTNCKQTLSSAAAVLNNARTEILTELRSGRINISSDQRLVSESACCSQSSSNADNADGGQQPGGGGQRPGGSDQELRDIDGVDGHGPTCGSQHHGRGIERERSYGANEAVCSVPVTAGGGQEYSKTAESKLFETCARDCDLLDTLTQEFIRRTLQ